MVMKQLRDATKDMTPSEAMVKLAIASVFEIFIIGIFAAGGFLLANYSLHTAALVTALVTIFGAVIGTIIAFFGVIRIVIFKRKGG